MNLSIRSASSGALILAVAVFGGAYNLISDDTAAPPEPVIDEPCNSQMRWEGVTPIATDSEGAITSLSAISDGATLADSETLFVKVEVAPGTVIERLLIDTDGDRLNGMWTLQSHLSGSAWNVIVDAQGNLAKHHGPPTKWNFEPAKGAIAEAVQDGSYLFCIPLAEIGSPTSVSLAVENADASLPARFVRGADYPPKSAELSAQEITPPGRLGFNYSGTPWIVRDCRDEKATHQSIKCAATVYQKFDQVVFDTDFSTHFAEGMKDLVTEVRERKSDIEVWGYVSIVGSTKGPDGFRAQVYDVADVLEKARLFKRSGMTGIFLDEYDVCDPSYETCQPSPDGGIRVTREKQVEVVEGLHAMGLAVFANGHSVVDALGEFGGLPTPLGSEDGRRDADQFLIENPTLIGGELISGVDFEAATARFAQAIELSQATGVRIAVLDSTSGFIADDALNGGLAAMAWWRAAQAGASAFALTNGGPQPNDGNMAILESPGSAKDGYGDLFEATPVRVLNSGRVMERYVTNCEGTRIGAIRIALSRQDAGFFPSGTPSEAC